MREPLTPYERLFRSDSPPATFRPGGIELTRRAIQFCAFQPGMRVLDVGCGTGGTVSLLKREFRLNADGIDPLVSRDGPAAEGLFYGYGENLPFPEESYDAVLAECSLTVTEDRAAVLREMYRVLKASGLIVISDIYRRDGGSKETGPVFQEGTCPAGASSKEEFLRLTENAHFSTLLWEDHTGLLHSFIAEYIMNTGSYRDFLSMFLSGRSGCSCSAGDLKGSKLGYYLYIGKKEESWKT